MDSLDCSSLPVACHTAPLHPGTIPGETKRTFKVRLGEHKQAVKRGDPKNGIAVHAHESNHTIDWDGARVERSVKIYSMVC